MQVAKPAGHQHLKLTDLKAKTSYVDNKTIVGKWKNLKRLPANTKISDTLSKDLKKRGMSFVGSTIIYAFMQAVGIVNDHTVNCFQHPQKDQIHSK